MHNSLCIYDKNIIFGKESEEEQRFGRLCLYLSAMPNSINASFNRINEPK
jgi:hypothetical protein